MQFESRWLSKDVPGVVSYPLPAEKHHIDISKGLFASNWPQICTTSTPEFGLSNSLSHKALPDTVDKKLMRRFFHLNQDCVVGWISIHSDDL